ncbi:hypothetical protein F4677DRAFT_419219 [Hypoxylon crocopeplum]|nr:hypothetical protein F4677DRAFT_419219 [Hypoxylon crocopeplum]
MPSQAMTQQWQDIEEGSLICDRIEPLQQAHALIRRIRNSIQHRGTSRPTSYPPVSSIPQTSLERLRLAFDDTPDGAGEPSTVLYLAYGSNLSSETFLGRRGIRPISQINVSAPGFDLAFDLPGLPYWEPCFSNATPRKIPKPPFPGDPPKPPFPPPSRRDNDVRMVEEGRHPAMPLLPALPPEAPSWSKGMYGVVYEVSRADYGKIIRTEGGGASYHDVLTPCLALPPSVSIPEKPPIPELPRPFMAHTLYAPRLPSFPDDDDGDDDDDEKRWWRKLLLPVRRPAPDYAQPSPRYMRLILDGAREHYLPDDYQAYLGRLPTYKITTWRQEIGRWLLLLTVLPFFALTLVLSSLLAGEDGTVPRWLAAASTVSLNLVWIVYDAVFKPVFGDGEHTIEDEDEDMRRQVITNLRDTHLWGNEKNALLADW